MKGEESIIQYAFMIGNNYLAVKLTNRTLVYLFVRNHKKIEQAKDKK